MGFFTGNQYWKKRARHGRKTKLTPETLVEEFLNYIEWIESNPLYKTELVKYKEHHELVEVPVKRPYSTVGFCLYAGITFSTFLVYEKNPDFVEATAYVRKTVESQQIEGASSGFFNANIVARLNGLVDKKEVKQDRHSTRYTPEERKKRIAELAAKKESGLDENDELF